MPSREIVEDMSGDCRQGYCSLRQILKLSGIPVDGLGGNGRCNQGGECLLKEKVLRTGFPDFLLEQFKCIEIYKWELNKDSKIEIGWDEAIRSWNQKGFAEKFRRAYKDGMKHSQLYVLVMQ